MAGTFSLKRVRALIVKESLQVIRDPSAIVIAFILPVVLLVLFATAVSLDIKQLPIAVVKQDNSSWSESLSSAFSRTRYFIVEPVRDLRQAQEKVASGKLNGVVIIPDNFSQRIASGERSNLIQIITDASQPNTANFVANYSQNVAMLWAQQTLSDIQGQSINVENRVWFNPEVESKRFLIPGAIGIVMTMIGTLLTALVIAREWEKGTMEALISTPAQVNEILIGKLIPYFGLGLIATVICVLLATYAFDVPLVGSWWAVLLLSSCFLVPALGQGLLISTVAKNQFVASILALMSAFLPAYLLSGFLFEIDSMPYVIQLLTYVLAVKYYIACIQTVFLAGDIWPLFIPNIAAMLFIGLVFFIIAHKKSSKTLEE
ncbi:ABC transporter permease [Vibrio sp. JC009]|uniref:ABC transporter permease n=1 Tax=Vibrio sp. JC009 TaxID=2912314 RepID=UPI0023B0A93C|nr:ABC transporter permease [Vibrio sp. JC009]WED23380.1 ABC transporter permease [Vibrio sp. JC009]